MTPSARAPYVSLTPQLRVCMRRWLIRTRRRVMHPSDAIVTCELTTGDSGIITPRKPPAPTARITVDAKMTTFDLFASLPFLPFISVVLHPLPPFSSFLFSPVHGVTKNGSTWWNVAPRQKTQKCTLYAGM